ncbi:VOC family protein [Vagococcus intermedius]|uniref:VOC family protein n=1 Tax=Vagococcus intermedius TaxID=2991418 RepID=A0AAF0I5Y2_9ENTE|nr:VOC family protein [Vagococcus intermedius]WEG72464.1 VOC family protein [Vagococcus intermedius]WEG74551.1 VOC family protein [Vagococcus intermedius]
MNLNNLKIKEVTLNVTSIERMITFYTEKIGLHIGKQTMNTVELLLPGEKEPALILKETKKKNRHVPGLYHIAYLLPTRPALATITKHLLDLDYPLIGASDHGYSEAIYLNDPEENGIELYWDKPESLWNKQPGGKIIGTTNYLDIQSLLEESQDTITPLQVGTIMGHIHLSVSDLKSESDFFTKVLGFTVTSSLNQSADFYGIDGYHHQFAANNWHSNYPRTEEEEQNQNVGLNQITVLVSKTMFNQTKANLENKNVKYKFYNNTLQFSDPNNIVFNYVTN